MVLGGAGKCTQTSECRVKNEQELVMGCGGWDAGRGKRVEVLKLKTCDSPRRSAQW